jgi:hypothetical protein
MPAKTYDGVKKTKSKDKKKSFFRYADDALPVINKTVKEHK